MTHPNPLTKLLYMSPKPYVSQASVGGAGAVLAHNVAGVLRLGSLG